MAYNYSQLLLRRFFHANLSYPSIDPFTGSPRLTLFKKESYDIVFRSSYNNSYAIPFCAFITSARYTTTFERIVSGFNLLEYPLNFSGGIILNTHSSAHLISNSSTYLLNCFMSASHALNVLISKSFFIFDCIVWIFFTIFVCVFFISNRKINIFRTFFPVKFLLFVILSFTSINDSDLNYRNAMINWFKYTHFLEIKSTQFPYFYTENDCKYYSNGYQNVSRPVLNLLQF